MCSRHEQARLLEEVHPGERQDVPVKRDPYKTLTIALALLIPLASVGLYLQLGNLQAFSPLPVHGAMAGQTNAAESLKSLEERVAQSPADPEALLMLARSGSPVSTHIGLLITIAVTTVCWVATAYLAPQTDRDVLVAFFRQVRPAGRGWEPIRKMAGLSPDEVAATGDNIPLALLGWVAGCAMVWSGLFFVGSVLYGRTWDALWLAAVFVVSALAVRRVVTTLWAESGHAAGRVEQPSDESVGR